ncbi:MAG: type I methionyl aminopeptidase [Verrucomicrobiales bacterium]|nr:type I methionyl aminopeptidase [Verrucomicrobiales bacterium]
MIIIKNEQEQDGMRRAGRVAARVLDEVARQVRPGITTAELDAFGAGRIAHHGGRSAFLGYRKYPCHLCISVNEEVVHGIASERRLQFGDLVSLDVGVHFRGFIGDNARTVCVGGCSPEQQRLMDVTEQSLHEAIGQAVPGNRVADISRAVQKYVERAGYSVVREFVGHGVGRSMHEEPQVPNYIDGKRSPRLKAGMTLAIEPMVNAGLAGVRVLSDNWTVVTEDGLPSAHFEHTVLVTGGAPEILTCLDEVLC